MTTFWDRCAPMMGLQYVRRWALVQMDRDQSVADHSLRVWVMARDLYMVLDPIGHNIDNRRNVELWALVHDADEYWTSDLPGHVKKALNELSPDIFARYVETKFKKVMPEYLQLERGIKNSIIETIVKICDLVESLLYLKQHGTKPVQVEVVSQFIAKRLEDVIEKGKFVFPTMEWNRLGGWIDEVLDGRDSIEHFRLVATP